MSRKSLIFIAATLVALTLAGCSQEQQALQKEAPAIPVIATTPTVKDITVYLESIGTLEPYVSIDIKPQCSGPLTDVKIKDGQLVKRGEPLFKIDSRPYEIRVQEAEAQFAIDSAGLKAVQKKMDRYKDLAERDLVAKIEWDELKAQIKKAQAMIDLDTARLKLAKLELDYCTVNSPLDGHVRQLEATTGSLVSAGQPTPLANITQINPILVEFTVTEKEFALMPKEHISIQLHSLCTGPSDECITGKITFRDHHFDPKTGLQLIRAEVTNPEYVLRPGQTIKVQIPIAETKNALLIPQKAIRYNQQGPYIYVVSEDMTVALKQLVLGKEQGLDQIVLEGVNPEEQVVLEGHLRLSPGLKVEIKS